MKEEKATKESEILDLLEKAVVDYTENFIGKLDIKGLPITRKMAENLVAKIGTRIAFRDSLGQKRIDDILLNPTPTNR